MAWATRGDGLLKDTPLEKIEQMEKYLNLASSDLRDSLAMTARPYLSALYLLNVNILDGSAHERRHWFDRGTEIDPKNA